MRNLLPQTIDSILFDSVFKQEEIVDGKLAVQEDMIIKVDAIVSGFWFHKERLEKHRATIVEILKIMPTTFHKSTGGGWSFLNLSMDKYGDQWGEHVHAQNLYALAAGLGLASFTMPREMWEVFPGKMPYVVFDIEENFLQ